MSLRDKINQNPGLGLGIGVGILVIAVLLIIYLLKSGGPPSDTSVPDQAFIKGFFSDDDGKTWFIGDLKTVPPFDHDGKKAYRAIVFHNKAGEKFCAYLEGYDDAQKKRLEAKMQQNIEVPSRVLGDERAMVKRPGKGAWVKIATGANLTPEYHDIIERPDPPSHNPDDAFGPPMVPSKADIKAGSGTFAQ